MYFLIFLLLYQYAYLIKEHFTNGLSFVEKKYFLFPFIPYIFFMFAMLIFFWEGFKYWLESFFNKKTN